MMRLGMDVRTLITNSLGLLGSGSGGSSAGLLGDGGSSDGEGLGVGKVLLDLWVVLSENRARNEAIANPSES